ncbi:MAG: hypothetical protein ACQERF_06160 [Actinomycetota bacterium]
MGSASAPGDRDDAHAITRRVIAWGTGFGVVVGAAILAGRPVQAGFFTPDGVLIGAGDARHLALAGAITTGIHTPLALAVHLRGAGLTWLWVAHGTWITARAVVLWWRARGEEWMRLGEA